MTTEQTLIVNVEDIQDSAPYFPGLPYRTNIVENQSVGTPVFTVLAVDGDEQNPRNIEYYFVSRGIYVIDFCLIQAMKMIHFSLRCHNIQGLLMVTQQSHGAAFWLLSLLVSMFSLCICNLSQQVRRCIIHDPYPITISNQRM